MIGLNKQGSHLFEEPKSTRGLALVSQAQRTMQCPELAVQVLVELAHAVIRREVRGVGTRDEARAVARLGAGGQGERHMECRR